MKLQAEDIKGTGTKELGEKGFVRTDLSDGSFFLISEYEYKGDLKQMCLVKRDSPMITLGKGKQQFTFESMDALLAKLN